MPKPKTDAERTIDLNKTERFFKNILRILFTLVAIVFVNNLVRQIVLPEIANVDARILLKTVLIGYLYCWYYGCSRDVSVQRDIFVDAPSRKLSDLLLMAGVTIGFAWLFTVEDMGCITVAFICFIILNMCGWMYLKKRTEANLDQAVEAYQKKNDIVSVIRTNFYREYMFGAWQRYRFGTGIGFLLVLVLVAFSSVPIPVGVPRQLLFSAIVAVMIAVLEVWMWHRRLVLAAEWKCVARLHSQGHLKSESKDVAEQAV